MDDKRTKIGPTGPVRPTGAQATAQANPTPAPETDPPYGVASHQAVTSYLPPPPTDPLLGQTLAGRYLIGRKLGEGGMGAVYLATHNVLEKQVALKVLHGEFARKPDLVERFMQEAKAASRIRHENVIDISDFGSTPDGLVFFAMELLNGHDLHEEVARARLAGQLLPWSRSKRIFLQICGALSAAHRHGIVHRDLKPENVYLVDFLGEADFVKLLDFGIAKLTEVNEGDRKLTKTGMLFGTPEYMSPEQARGDHVDHRVDIYAMGCILFQLVTGRVPFEAENFMGVLSLHLTEPPPMIPTEVFDRIGAPRELAGVIEQALAKDRAHRFQTIDDFANAVRIVCGEAPIAPGGTSTIPAQRAASVQAPAETRHRVTPAPIPVPVTGSPTGRVRTQWTGNLSVPEMDEPGARPRSKLPLIIGGVVLAGGAAIAVVLAMGGSKDKAAPVAPVGGGSAVIAAPPGPSEPPRVAPPQTPPEAPLPEKVTVTVDSKPRGAIVKDLMSGTTFGPTPRTFPVVPSHKLRQFSLVLKGYRDAQIEFAPDKPTIEHVEVMVRGEGAAVTVPKQVGSAAVVAPAVPDAGVPQVKPPPDAGAVQVKPPPTQPPDDCPEEPCLKADPSRAGSGSAP